MSATVQESIVRRHSIRSFTPTPLTEEEITALLDAARLAPSSLNSQPWRFAVITDPPTRQWLASKEISRQQSWLADAPAIIVCCADLEGYIKDSQASAFFMKDNNLIEGEPMTGIEDYVQREQAASDVARFGAAAMNVGIAVSFMMLRAVDLNLGSCWVGMFNEPAIKDGLQLGPEIRIVNLLAVGHPHEEEVLPSKRKSLAEIRLA